MWAHSQWPERAIDEQAPINWTISSWYLTPPRRSLHQWPSIIIRQHYIHPPERLRPPLSYLVNSRSSCIMRLLIYTVNIDMHTLVLRHQVANSLLRPFLNATSSYPELHDSPMSELDDSKSRIRPRLPCCRNLCPASCLIALVFISSLFPPFILGASLWPCRVLLRLR